MTPSLKSRLSSGGTAVGMWSIISSGPHVEIAALAGLDFQILDLEHGSFSLEGLGEAIRACEGKGCAPLVRVPDLNPAIFQSVLDLGAHGVIVPRIHSAADAENAVSFAKFPPRGQRGYNPFVRAAEYANPTNQNIGKLRNDFGLIAVIVENPEAFAELDSILEIPDIDVVYLGIYDMSLALGCEGNTADPRVKDFVEKASAQICAAGKTLGLMAHSPQEARHAARLGAKFLVSGVDSHIWRVAVSDMLAGVRLAVEGKE